MDELGSVRGLRVLDLGCGDAGTGVTVLAAGCATYHGVDGSRLMIEAATAHLDGTPATVSLGDLEDFEACAEPFDLIVSRMALHYLEDIGALFGHSYRSLTAGGRIVFTVTHPVVTSNDRRASTNERRQDWLVDNYFIEGPRAQVWLGTDSVWQHRTIETYIRELRGAGFDLTNLRECAPRPESFDDASEFQRRHRIPLILLMSGRRP
jgi:cyclopropane fatty-acyl-phospholipid synthase-like methyltransferase